MSDLYRKTRKPRFVGGSLTPVAGKAVYERLSRREVLEALGAEWRCFMPGGHRQPCRPDKPHKTWNCAWVVPAGDDR